MNILVYIAIFLIKAQTALQYIYFIHMYYTKIIMM